MKLLAKDKHRTLIITDPSEGVHALEDIPNYSVAVPKKQLRWTANKLKLCLGPYANLGKVTRQFHTFTIETEGCGPRFAQGHCFDMNVQIGGCNVEFVTKQVGLYIWHQGTFVDAPIVEMVVAYEADYQSPPESQMPPIGLAVEIFFSTWEEEEVIPILAIVTE
jgi:hypothetical protein